MSGRGSTRAQPARRPANARACALAALLAWADGRTEFLDEALAGAGIGALVARDAALARELALGSTRIGMLYDHLAQPFLRGGCPPPLCQALRLGCHQLFGLDRKGAHAAVAETVEAVRALGHPRLVPVANAVLRRLGDLAIERDAPGPLGRLAHRSRPADLAIAHGLPPLLIRHLATEIADRGPGCLDAFDAAAPLCTRTRRGAPAGAVRGRSILRAEGEWTWWEDPHEAIAGPVAAGHCVVQDRCQGRAVAIARPRLGERALDLCAAPGGKSLALIEAGCAVFAADASLDKARSLAGLPRRLVQDGRRPALAGGFALVLVDAPCSNSGVLARRPEARWRFEARALERLVDLQRDLLAAAAALVAPGGRMVYSTCSVDPLENQQVAHGLTGWRVLAEERTWPDGWQGGGYAASLVRS